MPGMLYLFHPEIEWVLKSAQSLAEAEALLATDR